MLARKPKMLVTVALANKTARVVWALMARGQESIELQRWRLNAQPPLRTLYSVEA